MSTRRIGFLSAVRRWWPVVALATGAGVLLGYAYASRVTPVYEAEAKLVVGAPVVTIAEQQAAGELVPTYAELVKTRQLLEPALRRLGLPLTPQDLEGDVRGEAGEETRVLTIRVRDEDPGRAVRLANELARELTRFVARNRPSRRVAAAANAPDVRLRVVERATRADRVRPQTILTMEFAALAGAFAALAVCVLVESLSRRVGDEDDLARVAPSVLGSVNGGVLSRSGGGKRSRPQAGGGAVDPYRALARRLGEPGQDGALRSLLVLGAQGGAGSGAVALNLAAAVARPGSRVVLTDLGHTREILRLFERSSSGVSLLGKLLPPVRHGGVTLDRFPIRPRPELVVAAPRAPEPRTTTLDDAQALLALLLADADVLIAHAASLADSPAALAWARAVNGTLVVARRRHTKRESVTDALESLERARTNVVGTVLHETR
jgi:capsular polysaccharide biosynthesis protein